MGGKFKRGKAPDSSASTVILDIGHGNSAVVRSSGETLVVDAGPGSGLLEHLLDEKIDEVDAVLISHADKDHIGGVIALLGAATVTVRRVVLNTDSSKGSDEWDDLLFELENLRLKNEIEFRPALVAGDDPFVCGDVSLEVLAPSPYLAGKGPGATDRRGRKLTSNSVSAVLRLVHAGNSRILFMGDIDEVGFHDLTRCQVSAKADVLVFPHHGGQVGGRHPGEFARKLISATDPNLVVFSIGRRRQPNNPLPEIVKAVRKASLGLRVVCTQLSLRCADSVPHEEPPHLLPIYARGRPRKQCCAGSVVVPHEAREAAPAAAAHTEFIKNHAPTALCRN